MECIPTTPRKGKLKRRFRSVAPPSSKTGLINDVQHDSLSDGRRADPSFLIGFLMDWVCNAGKCTEFFVLRLAIKHMFVSSFLHAAMIPDRHRGCDFLSMKDIETL